MRLAALFLGLVACGGEPDAPGRSVPATAAATTPVAAAPAAEVGPDGPADLTVPAFVVGDDADDVARGKVTFDAKGCGGCHAFGSVLVGPDLTGLAERRTDTWIAKMILHPDVMTKKDPAARELFKKHMLQMPNQGVAEGEVGDLIAFLTATP